MIKNINHIAIIVPDLEGAVAFWEGALGLKLARTESVPEEGVDVAFLPVGGSNVELLKPTVADTGVARFLEKRGPASTTCASRSMTSKPPWPNCATATCSSSTISRRKGTAAASTPLCIRRARAGCWWSFIRSISNYELGIKSRETAQSVIPNSLERLWPINTTW